MPLQTSGPHGFAGPSGRAALAPSLIALGLLAAAVLIAASLGRSVDPASPAFLEGGESARSAAPPSTHEAPEPARKRALDAYAKLSPTFVQNGGQLDRRVRYYAQGSGYAFHFTEDEIVLSFAEAKRGATLHLTPLGANPNARLEASERAPGKVNYLSGSERHANLPTYRGLAYRELWPGIDLIFRGQGAKLKYEFALRPGADPSDIRLAYRGAQGLAIGAAGNLLIETPLGVLRDSRPRTFLRVARKRVPVASRYRLERGQTSYGFALGPYDRGHPLVIDPGLVYSTLLGNSNCCAGGSTVALDASGSAYIAGQTENPSFPPATPGAFDPTYNDTFSCEDAFVTKLNPAGSALVYSTFLGGSSCDNVGLGGIAVDSSGNAYITGQTDSADFPTTAGSFDPTLGPGADVDAYVAKLNPAGSALVYSTYLGGDVTIGNTQAEGANGIALDASRNAYVIGITSSPDFPTTAGAFDTTFNGGTPGPPRDVFVTKLNAAGSALSYSTYLGGAATDRPERIAVDGSGSAYATGFTASSNFPTTAGAFDTTTTGNDAFVTKLSPAGSTLAYSTYLANADINAIALDQNGSAYLAGGAYAGFPTTPGAFDTTYGGGTCEGFPCPDGFVTKLSSSGTALVYSTYLGGSRLDSLLGIAVDASGSAYVTGGTHRAASPSLGYPTTPGAFDRELGGPSDAVVSKLNPAGSTLLYSTYLGGVGSSVSHDGGQDVAIDSGGNAYVMGHTSAPDFPTTPGAFDQTFAFTDVFVAKLDLIPGPIPPDPPTPPAPDPPLTPALPELPVPVRPPPTSAQTISRPPRVVVTLRRSLDVDGFDVIVTCGEQVLWEIVGFIRDRINRARGGVVLSAPARRTYKFKRIRRNAAANQRLKVRLKLPKKSLRTVKRALRRGVKLTATVKITATDTSGQKTVKSYKVRVRP